MCTGTSGHSSGAPHWPTTAGSGPALATVTVTAAEVATLPALSRATAVRVWLPAETPAEFQLTLYGAVVSSAPIAAPSARNVTPARPPASAALAETATVPVTVAPFAGAVSDTVGGVVSPGGVPLPSGVAMSVVSSAALSARL